MGAFDIVEQGRKAALEGKPMFANPYIPQYPTDSPYMFMSWFAGWCKGEKEKAEGLVSIDAQNWNPLSR